MSGAFVSFYEQNFSDVYAYLVYRVGSRAQAERLTQATFERAAREWEALGSDRDGARVWLFSLAREAAIGRPRPTDADRPGLPGDLASALAQLEQSERSVVALRLGGRLTGPQIARVLNVSESIVRRRLSRGLRRLRAELEPRSARGPELDRQDRGEPEQGET